MLESDTNFDGSVCWIFGSYDLSVTQSIRVYHISTLAHEELKKVISLPSVDVNNKRRKEIKLNDSFLKKQCPLTNNNYTPNY